MTFELPKVVPSIICLVLVPVWCAPLVICGPRCLCAYSEGIIHPGVSLDDVDLLLIRADYSVQVDQPHFSNENTHVTSVTLVSC